MVDKFATYSPGLDSPATDVFPITPDDDIDLAVATRAIRADTGGDGGSSSGRPELALGERVVHVADRDAAD